MTKLKGFISFSHEDEPYFHLIKDGFKRHGKHSKLIDADLWHDGKILAGSLWHESIQKQVKGCDFAIYLVSSGFFSSEYIEEHEFKIFLKRQEESGFLFFPLLVSPCNFLQWEALDVRQFFKPLGETYGVPEAKKNFTFSHLVNYHPRTGDPFPNPYREQYLMDALAKIEAALAEYQQRNETRKKLPKSDYYKALPIADIQPVDFLKTRSLEKGGFRPQYLRRPYLDEQILYNFQHKRHTIVTGKPLAGKTRSVFELCDKKLKDKDILILIPEMKNINPGDFLLPETDTALILFFDDFQNYTKLDNLEWMLEKALLRENTWVVATCRKDQLYLVENQLTNLYHHFDVKKILPLNEAEEKALPKEVPGIPNRKSDGTIGGYFLPIAEMRKRFNSLPEGGLEREIFHAFKALRAWGKTGTDAGIEQVRLKEYCYKRLQFHYNSEREISQFEWDRAFQTLALKDLIGLKDEKVFAEEVYLDDFIKIKPTDLDKEFVRVFPSVKSFTILLHKAPDFQTAQGVLALMKSEGVRPDEVTFSSLLNKAPDFQTAQGALALMKSEGVRPNEVTFNSLLNKAPDFQTAQGVLALMKSEGVRPDEVTFSSLLNKAPDFQTAQGALALMKSEGVRPNEVTFNSLLNKAPDFQTAQGVLALMKSEGVRPDEVTFSSLLNKAPDFQTAQGALALMKSEGVRPNEVTFNSLLNKAPDFQTAQGALALMKSEGVRPDEVTFSSLLHKAPDFQTAQGVLALMKSEGVRPDEVTFSSLLHKAPDFQTAQGVLALMKSEGVRPNEVTFSSLLHKAPDFQTAQGVLALMKSEGVRPDEVTFSSLLHKAPDFQTAQGVLALMKSEGVRPNEVTFNSLLNKAPDFQTAQGVLALMKSEGVRPNEVTFNSLLNKAPDFQTAQGALALMKSEGVRPDEVTFSSLLNKAISPEEVEVVMELRKEAGLSIEDEDAAELEKELIAQIEKRGSYQVVVFTKEIIESRDVEVPGILEKMKAAGVLPDVHIYNLLFYKSPDFAQSKALVLQMKATGIQPDEMTFKLISSRALDFESTKWVWEEFENMDGGVGLL